MKKTYEDEKEIASELKETKEVSEAPKGRGEFEFFFPDERRTIRATSLEEAMKKLKEEK